MCSIGNDPIPPIQKKSKSDYLKNFVPDFFIKEQLDQDLQLLEKMKNLFFEAKPFTPNSKDAVYKCAVNDYGAREVMLLTQDNFRISSLYFKRPNAPINIIYVTGYFHDQTPLKEWGAPFAVLFPNFNILTFDWRGFGESDGRKGKWIANEFGTNAYNDIQAAIDFLRKESDKPIVLVGFCFGAAMILNATLKAKEHGKSIADALVLNSIFTYFENQFNRALLSEKRWYRRILIQLGIGRWLIDFILQGSLFELKPIQMIENIDIPCYFEHFTGDPFAIIEEGIEVFKNTKSFKMFLQSDIGRHVRIHSKAPYQYRNYFYNFLLKCGLLKEEEFLKISS